MNKIIIVAFILSFQFGFSQVKEMNPTSFDLLDLSAQGEKDFKRIQKAREEIMGKYKDGVEYENLKKEEKDILSEMDGERENYWDIIGVGCGWYCGGGPKKISASSYLNTQGKNNYNPQNAHDLNYKSAWVEGVDGYGIGEYLLYTFENESPRINEIIIVNGYIKNKTSWENNSRVKQLKVYIDDEPYAILNLKDIRGVQSFKIEPIGRYYEIKNENVSGKTWDLKFEILDIYKGLKYDDVAISEIYFNGLDVHCFAKGTKIQMADQSIKNIEDLQKGDFVAYKDLETKQIKSAKIEQLENIIHDKLVKYKFESGLEIIATQDHPFRIKNNTWGSLKPDKSKKYKGFKDINKLTIGDLFLTMEGFEKLTSIEYLKERRETYTISKLSSGDNFIANGLIVGVEELK